VSYAYTPGAEGGLRWDDPELGIEWPMEPTVVSEKDASWPMLSEVPLTERLGGAK
jgi:dTDP-4-dehydrorhamnose 3,5-epimerase